MMKTVVDFSIKNHVIAFVFVSAFLLVLSQPVLSLVILQYHHISDDTPVSTSTSPKRFERHLELIEASGFNVVSIERVAEKLRAGEALDDRSVVISFDDGYVSIYNEALPRLKRRGWPFVVFINTRPHDESQSSHMSWDQLKELRKHKATIANHTVSHVHLLRRENDRSAAKIFKEEVESAEQKIKKNLGQSIKLFAYPYGEYDAAFAKQLKKHGYIGFGQHSGAVPSDVDLQRVPRFPFGGVYGQDQDFLTKLKSLAIEGINERALDRRGNVIEHPHIPIDVKRPIWQIDLPERVSDKSFACFASGQGAIKVEKNKNTLSVRANKPLKPGRSKYNCTARASSGRFYWLSTLWVKTNDQGQWVHQ